MTAANANFILRWVLNDVPQQAQVSTRLLEASPADSICVASVTLAEITYVMRGKGYDHRQVTEALDGLFAYPSVALPDAVNRQALELFRTTSLDFEDCLLVALHRVKGYDVAPFDTALQKQLTRK